jgi:hypothetical protein
MMLRKFDIEMKKVFPLFFLMLFFSTTLFAQADAQRPTGAKLQGLKIEFITKYLKLTTEEATFWPLYFDYNEEIRKARLEAPNDVIGTEEKILIIRKKYQSEFKKVLITD